MSEVSLAASRPRGHPCANSRKLVDTTKSPALKLPVSFSRMRRVFACTLQQSNTGGHRTHSGVDHVRGAPGRQPGPFVGRNLPAQYEWAFSP